MELIGLFNYWIVIFLMMVGFYIVIAQHNLVKKVVGLNIFQVSVFVFYISMSKITGGSAPILDESLIVRIRNAYGTIEEDDIEAQESEA